MSIPALERLLQHPALFRAGHTAARVGQPSVPTGYPELDRVLPWNGWPLGKLTEIIPQADAIGEITLLMPALATVTHEGRAAALVKPSYLPYAPALVRGGIPLERLVITRSVHERDFLWTLEQCLKSGACGAVLAWEQAALDDRSLRRLQLAAEAGNCLAFLFRSPRASNRASPAGLRLWLAPAMGALDLTVLKGQGAAGMNLKLPLPDV